VIVRPRNARRRPLDEFACRGVLDLTFFTGGVDGRVVASSILVPVAQRGKRVPVGIPFTAPPTFGPRVMRATTFAHYSRHPTIGFAVDELCVSCRRSRSSTGQRVARQ